MHSKKHALGGSGSDHTAVALSTLNQSLTPEQLDAAGTARPPTAHKTSHQNGGSDQMSVQGLTGLLATAQTPAAHASAHQNGGGDELSIAGLSGEAADAQTPKAHKTSHEFGGADAMSVANLSGLLATPQTPAAHKASHEFGGADAMSVANLSGLLSTPQTPAAHKASHEFGGGDQMSVANLTGVLATAQTPTSHAISHQNGGGDELSIAGLSGEAADAQTPKTHASSHATIGADPLTPANIGASPTGHTIQGSEHDLTLLTAGSVLAKDESGVMAAVPYTTQMLPNTILKRDGNSNVKVGTATDGQHAVSLTKAQEILAGGTAWKQPVETFMLVTDVNGGGSPPSIAPDECAIVNNWGGGNYENTLTPYSNGDLAQKTDTGWIRLYVDFGAISGARAIVGTGPNVSGSFIGQDSKFCVSDGDYTFTFTAAEEGDACAVSNPDTYLAFASIIFNGTQWVTMALGSQHNTLEGLQGGQPGEYNHLSSADFVAVNTKSTQIAQMGIDVVSAMNPTPTMGELLAAGWIPGTRGLFFGADGSAWFCYLGLGFVWTVEMGKVI